MTTTEATVAQPDATVMTSRRVPRLDPEWWAPRSTNRGQVKPRTEPPAVVAARMLKGIHDAYRAARADAKTTTSADLIAREHRYRQCYRLSRADRARHRALREELRSRGIELPPVPPKPRRRRLWTTTL